MLIYESFDKKDILLAALVACERLRKYAEDACRDRDSLGQWLRSFSAGAFNFFIF